jgi:hypothetical protein
MTCTDAQFDAVLDEITAGKTVVQACDSIGVALHSFQKLVRSGGNERNLAYARAMEQRADVLADQTLSIADDETKDPNRARNQIQARQWVASKHASKKYGDRIDLNVSQSLDITAILADARQRLRPMCDQLPMIDAEVIETKQLTAQGATDNESDAAAGSIFD